MNIPVTPELFTLQTNRTGQQSIREAADEIIGLLDSLTFDEQEERILAILSVLPPTDFMRCLKILSIHKFEPLSRKRAYRVSYLEQLYIDMDGAEFDALCFMMRSRLLAAKCGTLERAEEVMRAVFAGKTTPEVPLSLDFGPAKLTAPSTYSRRTYPYHVEFEEDGSISGDWYEHIGWYKIDYSVRKFKMQLSDLSIAHYIHLEGKNEIVTAFDLKRMSDDVQVSFWFTTVNVIDIVLGCGAVSAAKGMARTALAAFLQVAIPALGQLLDDHEEWLMESAIGREVLTAFRIFSLGLAGFGVARLMSTGGRSLIDKLAKAKADLLAGNSGNAIAQKISDLVDSVIETFEDLKAEFSSTLMGSKAPKRPPILDELKNRQPFDPQIPPPRIAGGVCVATGKSELEMFVEIQKRPGSKDLVVLQEDDVFLLVEKTGNDVPEHAGFSVCDDFAKIADFFDNVESAKKALVTLALRNAPKELEVGIYKKLIGGKWYFIVMDGHVGFVRPPSQGWDSIGHYHHNAANVLGFQNPALKDIDDCKYKAFNVGPDNRYSNIIFSHDSQGKLVEIEYGIDLNFDDASYYVVAANGTTHRFVDIYPGDPSNPTQWMKELEKLDLDFTMAGTLKKVKLLSQLDEKLYYGGWWAKHFP